MTKPTDREIFEGEIATYWFDEGILVSLSKSPKRTVENIKANVQLVKQITNNKPIPLLIYLSNSPVPDKLARKYSTRTITGNLCCHGNGIKTTVGEIYHEFIIRIKKTSDSYEKFY